MSTDRIPARPYSRGAAYAQSADEASAFDDRAIRTVGVPEPVLMENAGRSAALVASRLFRPARVVALVGSGNNGGDALVALRSLGAWGVRGTAVLVADRSPDDPLLHGWPIDVRNDADLSDDEWRHLLSEADLVLDGILGTGVRGAPRARQAAAIERVLSAGTPVLALDVPSGVDATSGAVPGAAVDATVTVAFGCPLLGTLVHPGRARVGRLVAVEIGFPPIEPEDAIAEIVTPEWARARLPTRDTDTHKNAVGRVLVVGGASGMAGAVILAARAVFASGAGLVRVCSVDANRDAVQSAVPEAIFVPADDTAALARAREASDALVCGPGLGTSKEAADLLLRMLGPDCPPTVLDADGLNLVASGAVPADVVAGAPVLMTPHPGEMARVEEGLALDSERPRVDRAVALAGRLGATVLLKGAPSLVATDGAPVLIDAQGSSDLAVAGMGDTLSGVCGALLARGLPAAEAGALGLYLSGRAAVLAGRGAGLTPSDVIACLPDVLGERTPASTDLDLPFVTFDADPAR